MQRTSSRNWTRGPTSGRSESSRRPSRCRCFAIERKRDDDTWAALTMGTEGAGQVNPRIAFALPHSAAVLDCSLTLRQVAADYPEVAWRD